MIKINLGLRKQAAAIAGKEKGGAPGLSAMKLNPEALKEILKDPQVRTLILVIVVAVLGTYFLNGYKDEQLHDADNLAQKATLENQKVKAELAKTTGYDDLKKQFDADEELIRTKLQTIQKLVSDRAAPPKLLLSLSIGIPKDVWLSEINITDQEVKLKGFSLGFDQITDFMKTLGDNEFLTDLKLGDSQKAKDPTGIDVASFDLVAKKK
jgi:Tfp pilus assembly protein PilN